MHIIPKTNWSVLCKFVSTRNDCNSQQPMTILTNWRYDRWTTIYKKKKRRDNCIYRRIPITDLFVNSYLFFSISSWNANKERNDYTEDYMRCILKCKLFHTHPLLQIEKAMSFSLYRNVNRYLRFGFVSKPRIVRRIYLHQIYRDLSR